MRTDIYFSNQNTMLSSKSSCDPPFLSHCSSIFHSFSELNHNHEAEVFECELPLIDLNGLRKGNGEDRAACVAAIGRAASEWAFFQVVNHGLSRKLLDEMRMEQRKLFELPFEVKAGSRLFNGSYRWGTPSATCLSRFSWSEAFHVPLARISSDEVHCTMQFEPRREVMEKLAKAMMELASTLAGVLADNLGHPGHHFLENCNESTCFLRLNRYPKCPLSPILFGLQPHTDSDFLTILCQDGVGGLQLMKDSKWVAVKPIPNALVVNIGDLLQAWSNDKYKSVEHKVMANAKRERYSMAFFLCPSYDAVVGSCEEPSKYINFTFGEFRRQVQEDVIRTGHKLGLSRFLRQI